MGCRGSEYDDGIKRNKSLSKAEIRIETEGTQFTGLPKIGLRNIGLYESHAEKAIVIMNRMKNVAIINNTIQNRPSDYFIDKLLDEKIQGADGGYYVAENDYKTNNFVTNILGYQDVNAIALLIPNYIKKGNIFDMRYSDRYVPAIGGKKMEGQLYEFLTQIPDRAGKMHSAYVKIMNIHAKNGATYSIVMSVHNPQRNITPIWQKQEANQPRYNKGR